MVEQGQGDLRLGLEANLRGHMGLGTSGQVFSPVPGQVQPGRDRPGHSTFGIVAVDGDLAVAFLAQGAGVLPGDAHRALALLGEAGVIEDQDAVSLAGQSEHLLDTLAVEVVLVPSRGGEQALELLFGGVGDARGDGIAVLVGQLGQQPSQVAVQGMSPFAAREMHMERLQERGQLGQWLGGSLRNTNSGLHTPLYARTPKRQSSIKQFVGENLKTLVPRVLGQTEKALGRKIVDRGEPRKWNEASFFLDLSQRRGEQEAAVARRLLEWATKHNLRIWWGEGKKDGSFFPMYDNKFGKNFLFSVWTYGSVELQFQHMKKPPFAEEGKRKELAQRLSAIGLSIPEETLKKRPTFGLSLLLEPGRLDKFLEAFDWMLTEIKKVEIKEDSDQPADRPEGAHPENSEYGTPA